MALLETVILLDTRANQPGAAAVGAGTLFSVTDEANKLERSNGTSWANYGPTVSASTTGNAATATALQTARTINGTSFNGTANITVTAAAGTLTGGTLNATVLASSLTSVGSLVAGSTGTGFTIALSVATVTGTLDDARLSANVPLLNVVNTFSAAGAHTWTTAAAGTNGLSILNTAAGTTNRARFIASSDVATIAMSALSSTFTPTLAYQVASGNTITASGSGGLSIATITANLRFYTNTTLVGTMFASGGFSWGDTTDPGATNLRVAGALTVIGAITGALTGNASTATALATPRAINGTSFDGTAAITVTAAAGTVTGATLNATVTASSLTSVGTLATLGVTTTITLTRDALAATSTDGIIIQNTTAATAGVPLQISPRLRFLAQVWNTTAVAATNTSEWWVENVPVSAAAPSTALRFVSSLNGAAGVGAMVLTNTGFPATLPTGTCTAGRLQLGAITGSFLFGAAGMRINGVADGQINFVGAAQAAGTGIDVMTDAVLKIRTRAQTGYATVDCLGLKASGVAGASFGPAAVASITVVNGIVTAIS